jgi:L-aminopeptidase/D-esterase-like protein
VPSAVLFDLNNGGDKDWGAVPPYRALGIQAVSRARAGKFELGNSGAGLGAVAGIYKGGLGSASALTPEGYTVGAVVAVNSFGSTTIPGSGRFWAAPFALDGELGDQSGARDLGDDGGLGKMLDGTKAHGEAMGHNTTIGVVATDAALTPVQAKRVAIMAHDGLARAIRPVHTPFDGDVIFVLSTGKKPLLDPAAKSLSLIGAVGADVTARAVARGVYEAQTLAGMSAYKDHHGQP